MLLAVDIGNSYIKFGIFDDQSRFSKFSIRTNPDSSTDELRSAIDRRSDAPVTDAIICSVVSKTEKAVAEFLRSEINIEPLVVKNDFDFGLKIDYEPLSALGTDRLVNAFSAVEKYGVPCIVCSFGTATTIDVVHANRLFLGGIIAPGMKTMSKALHLGTAQLPEVEIGKPERVIGTTTVKSVQSGVFYGHLGMVEGLITRIKNEIGDDPKVIATGGFAPFLAENTAQINILDENLTLDGLRLLFNRLTLGSESLLQ